ncbi:MAG: hypothetical protein FJX77_07865, partial [Armatimonadetes bacterium]|nr:hypothetical protein [Armatimonadota bacterium]
MTQAAVQPAEKEATTSTRKVPVPPREWIDTERLLKARPQLRRAVLGLRGLLESQERSQAAGATAWMTAADYRFLGRGWVSLREWERAARAHEQATQLQPTGGDFFRIAYAHDEMAQSSGKPIPLLEKTVAAYQEALKHYTPQAAPLDYAATQNNLGAAYRDLAAHRDAQKNL